MATFKKRALQAPFIKIEKGLVVEGTIDRVRAEVKGKFGTKATVIINLTQPITQTLTKMVKDEKGKESKQTIKKTYDAGTAIQMDIKAGLVALSDEKPGTLVRVTCTGQVDTGKGNPAWTFDLEVAE